MMHFKTIEENDAGRSGGFLTCNLYPFSAIERNDVLRSELLYIYIGQSGEAGEHEEVTDKAETLDVELLLDDGLKALPLLESHGQLGFHVEFHTKVRIGVNDTKP